MRCGKCWGEGHTGFRCKTTMLNPAALPYYKATHPQPHNHHSNTKSFDDLLSKPCPLSAPALPSNRPKRLAYFADWDPAFLAEIQKLNNGIVFDTHGREKGFQPKDIASFATATNLVEKTDISIGILAEGKFLIILPPGVAPETFINATGPHLWEAGFSFQPWSPLDGGRIVLPEYKALLTLKDVPPHIRRDKEFAGAVSTFGTYLGSVPQEGITDLSVWTVAVAVDRLERIPDEIEIHAGGVEYIMPVQTKNWMRSPLYSPTELPKHQPKFSKPAKKKVDSSDFEEPFYVSRNFLRKLCDNVDPEMIPPEIRRILTSSATPKLTSDQLRLLINLQEEDEFSNPSVAISETGQSSQQGYATRMDTNNEPHSTNYHGVPVQPEKEVRQAIASHDQNNQKEKPKETQGTRRIMPQKISSPIRILQRSAPQKGIAGRAPIPRTEASVLEGSASQETVISRQTGLGRGQLLIGDKPGSSKRKTCPVGVGAQLKDKKEKFTSGKQAQQKPNKGVQFAKPPKHVQFKKAAQQSVARARQAKNKEAQKAQIELNQDGFYEVSIQYGHCSAIGQGCGLNEKEVEVALQEDNLQRREAQTQLSDEMQQMDNEMDNDGGDFSQDLEGVDLSFDSGEDLEAEEDMGV